MCPAHRLEVLKKVKLRILKDEPVLCISTQLIEAGVDVDFGSVIRALAGLDSIAQAAGRCNRNGLRSMGRVQIVNVAGESLKQLPDIRLAQEAAQRVLDESSTSGKSAPLDFSGPDLIERYFEYYFFDRRLEMSYPVSAEKVGRQDTLLNNQTSFFGNRS
jgi:CRISPR-associated endonuclease/helicase Cas3